jgi:hypothetical protein
VVPVGGVRPSPLVSQNPYQSATLQRVRIANCTYELYQLPCQSTAVAGSPLSSHLESASLRQAQLVVWLIGLGW